MPGGNIGPTGAAAAEVPAKDTNILNKNFDKAVNPDTATTAPTPAPTTPTPAATPPPLSQNPYATGTPTPTPTAPTTTPQPSVFAPPPSTTAPPLSQNPYGGALVGQVVAAKATGLSDQFISTLPNAARWATLTPQQQSQTLGFAFDYLGTVYGQDQVNQLKLYSLPPAQRAIAIQEMQNNKQFGNDFLNVMQQAPSQGILRHFATILRTLEDTSGAGGPAKVLGQPTVDFLNQQIEKFKEGSVGAIGGVKVPIVSAILGHLATSGDSISLTADQVRQHPGQALAIQQYIAQHAPGMQIHIEGSGVASDLLSTGGQVLQGFIQFPSIAAGVVGTAGQVLTQAARRTIGEPLAHAFGYTNQEISGGYNASNLTQANITPDDFLRQILSTNIPMGGLGGFFHGAMGMTGNDPRARYVDMIAGAMGGFSDLDPIQAFAHVREGLSLATKLPLGQDLVDDTGALTTFAQSQLKNKLAQMSFVKSAQSIEDVVGSPAFVTGNNALWEVTKSVPADEQVGSMMQSLKALNLPMDQGLAVQLVRAQGDQAAVRDIWTLHYYNNVVSDEAMSAALATQQATQAQLDRLTQLGNEDTFAGRDLYRGLPPEGTRIASDGTQIWHKAVFAADQPEDAYFFGQGGIQEKMFLSSDAKVLEPTDPEMLRFANTPRPNEAGYIGAEAQQPVTAEDLAGNNVQLSARELDRIAYWAKQEGYDAVHFKDPELGTAVFNQEKLTRNVYEADAERTHLMDSYDQILSDNRAATDTVENARGMVNLPRYPESTPEFRSAVAEAFGKGSKFGKWLRGDLSDAHFEGVSAGMDRFGMRFPTGKLIEPSADTLEGRAASIAKVSDLMKYMRVPAPEIRRIVQAWSDLKDPEAFFHWNVDWRGSIADTSPLLSKDPLMQDWWRNLYNDRGPTDFIKGVANKVDESGIAINEPVAYSLEPTLDGTAARPHPIAIEPSEWQNEYPLPTPKQITQSVSMYRRLVRNLPDELHNGSDLLGVTHVHNLFMDFIRGSALIPKQAFKMMFARVFGEGTAYLAAAGRMNVLDGRTFMDLLKYADENGMDPVALLEDPQKALGTMANRLLTDSNTQVSNGKAIVSPGDPTFSLAVSNRFAQLNASGELSRRLVEDSPEEVMSWMQSQPEGSYIAERVYKPWLSRATLDARGDPMKVLQAMKDERMGLIGNDPAMEEALKTGFYHDPANGELTQIGTKEFASIIEEKAKAALAAKGTEEAAAGWTPPEFTSGKFPVAMGADSGKVMDWFQSHLDGFFGFQKNLVEPEMKYMRMPLFRDMYQQEMERLGSLGVGLDRSQQLAANFAAEQTKTFFRDFTSSTPMEQWGGQFFPFFKAWKNVAERWGIRLPEMRGGWDIGALATARYLQSAVELFRGTGILRTDSQGRNYVTIPGVEDLIEGLTGRTLLRASPASFSILGSLPALAPAIQLPLSLAAQYTPAKGFLSHFSSILFPFGDNAQLAPSFANDIWEGLFHTAPPWEFASKGYQEQRMALVDADSVNLAREEVGPPPDAKSFKQGADDPAYRAAYKAWAEKIVSTAHTISTTVLVMHGLSSIISPASWAPSSLWTDKTAGLWRSLSVYPNGSPLKSAVLDQYNAMHPNANWFMVGKSLTNGGVVAPVNSFSDWLAQVANGTRTLLTPVQRTVWAAGLEELNHVHQERLSVINSLGGNLSGVLNNYYQYRAGTQKASEEFNRYMSWNKEFANLWNSHKKDIPTNAGASYFQAQDLLNVRNAMSDVSNLFTDQGIVDGDYTAFKGKVTGLLDKLGAFSGTTSSSPLAKDLTWYWEKVATPYYNQLDKMYTQLDTTPTALRAPIYEAIRALNNAQTEQTYKGQSVPTPEETAYNGLTPEMQKDHIAHWALGNPQNLDNFQLAKTYPGSGPKVEDLMTYIAQADTTLAQSGLSTSSNAYAGAQKYLQNQELIKAKELGVDPKWVNLQNLAPWQKLQISGYGKDNSTMQQVYTVMGSIFKSLGAQGISPSGTKPEALAAQQSIVAQVTHARANDPAFDALMSRLEIADAASGQPPVVGADMIVKVFFNSFGNASYAVAGGK